MSDPFTALFGEKLTKGDELVSTSDALAGKVAVGIYFSAHWCPPCRGFTPELVKSYKNVLASKGMEIIFVSSDKTEDEFKGYFAEMPWLALPYSDRSLKGTLSKKYKVSGIPTFVVLDGKTGEVITTDGRSALMSDPSGAKFPWKPPPIWDVLGSEFLSGTEGDTVEIDEIRGAGKVIGLYFSAHWCPPCRGFTPDLIKAYNAHLKAKGLEIIFVSSDRDQASFLEYYGTMPWLAIPNGDKRKDELSQRFGVEGIPSFVLIDGETGETINGNARGKISSDPEGKDFPYHPKPLNDMAVEGPGDINEEATLCVMMEGCDAATQAAALKALEPIASASKAAKEEMSFLYASKSDGMTGQVRALTKMGDATAVPQMLLMDIPDDGGFYVSPATEVTAETVMGFLEAYKAKSLERRQLGK